ncbi:MAG: hypothetical protein ACRCXD_10665 [Luteolibacter sp.]
MKATFILLLLCSAILSAESMMDSASIDQKIKETLFPSDEEMLSPGSFLSLDYDTSWITDDIRPIVIQKLRVRYENSGLNSPDFLEKVLVRAGDWDSTLRMIENIKDPRKDTAALLYASEEIIPFLIPLICNHHKGDLGAGSSDHDTMQLEVRRKAIEYFMLHLSDSKRFPLETSIWAGEGFASDTLENSEASAAGIANWWKHNQTAILEKRYQDAKWLPKSVDPYPARREKEKREILAALEPKAAERPAFTNRPTGALENSLKISSARPGRAPGDIIFKLFHIGIGTILGALSCYVWHRFVVKTVPR